jgi:large conductance mechanosensitive channel
MKIMKEFKDFAMRGNVMDMAIGIILGGAFGNIVSSLVKDVIMPPIGILLGGVDFSSLSVTLKDAKPAVDGVEAVEAVTLGYGMFINTIIDFLIVAFSIFMAIKMMNAAIRKREEEPKPPAPSNEEVLLGEIRDLLKAKS